jgi:hypothetical protein
MRGSQPALECIISMNGQDGRSESRRAERASEPNSFSCIAARSMLTNRCQSATTRWCWSRNRPTHAQPSTRTPTRRRRRPVYVSSRRVLFVEDPSAACPKRLMDEDERDSPRLRSSAHDHSFILLVRSLA